MLVRSLPSALPVSVQLSGEAGSHPPGELDAAVDKLISGTMMEGELQFAALTVAFDHGF